METSTKSLVCADCGVALTVEVPVSDAYPTLRGIVLVCDECSAKRDAQRAAVEAHQALRRRFAAAVSTGLLSDAVKAATFRGLNSAITALNAGPWEIARRWHQDAGNLFLSGPPGTGKTLLCRCILRRTFVSGFSVAEMSGRRLTKVAARFDEGAGLFEAWKRADVLLLDDIDKTHVTRDGVDALWELLDERCNARRATLVTANHCLSQVVNQYSEGNDGLTVRAAIDRLAPLTQLQMTGSSQR